MDGQLSRKTWCDQQKQGWEFVKPVKGWKYIVGKDLTAVDSYYTKPGGDVKGTCGVDWFHSGKEVMSYLNQEEYELAPRPWKRRLCFTPSDTAEGEESSFFDEDKPVRKNTAINTIDAEDQTGSDTYEDVSAEEVEQSRKNSDQATIEMMKAVRDSNKAFAFLASGMGSKAEKERAFAVIANVPFRAAEAERHGKAASAILIRHWRRKFGY